MAASTASIGNQQRWYGLRTKARKTQRTLHLAATSSPGNSTVLSLNRTADSTASTAKRHLQDENSERVAASSWRAAAAAAPSSQSVRGRALPVRSRTLRKATSTASRATAHGQARSNDLDKANSVSSNG